jgi:hypothetical protein
LKYFLVMSAFVVIRLAHGNSSLIFRAFFEIAPLAAARLLSLNQSTMEPSLKLIASSAYRLRRPRLALNALRGLICPAMRFQPLPWKID